MKKCFIMGTRVLLPDYFFNLYFFEYSSTFKIKVLVLVIEYLGLVLVPNTGDAFQFDELLLTF